MDIEKEMSSLNWCKTENLKNCLQDYSSFNKYMMMTHTHKYTSLQFHCMQGSFMALLKVL